MKETNVKLPFEQEGIEISQKSGSCKSFLESSEDIGDLTYSQQDLQTLQELKDEAVRSVCQEAMKRKSYCREDTLGEQPSKISRKNTVPDNTEAIEVLTSSSSLYSNDGSNINNSLVLGRKNTASDNSTKIDYFASLPDEVLLHIFHSLNHRPSLITCACVCARWKNIAYDSGLWERIDISRQQISGTVMGLILNKKPSILRMSQSTVISPLNMENFVSKIEYLDLSMANIAVEDLEILLRTCRSLFKLSLEYVEVNDNICVEIGNNSKLTTLNMSQSRCLNEPGLMAILNNCKRLTEVNFAWTGLNAASIKSVCQNISKDVEKLNLSGCLKEITDSHVRVLAIRCNKLKELDLSDATGISEHSVQAICDNLNHLEVLSLSRCYNIHPESYAAIFRLPSLTNFNIFGLFSDKQVERIRKTSHVKLNTMRFSFVARPTVGSRRTSIWGMQVRD